VLDGDPAPPKGGTVPQFSAYVCCGHPFTYPQISMLYNTFQSATHTQKRPFPWEHLHPILNPPDAASQTTPRSVQPFLHSSRQRVPMRQNSINARKYYRLTVLVELESIVFLRMRRLS